MYPFARSFTSVALQHDVDDDCIFLHTVPENGTCIILCADFFCSLLRLGCTPAAVIEVRKVRKGNGENKNHLSGVHPSERGAIRRIRQLPNHIAGHDDETSALQRCSVSGTGNGQGCVMCSYYERMMELLDDNFSSCQKRVWIEWDLEG